MKVDQKIVYLIVNTQCNLKWKIVILIVLKILNKLLIDYMSFDKYFNNINFMN